MCDFDDLHSKMEIKNKNVAPVLGVSGICASRARNFEKMNVVFSIFVFNSNH